MPLTKRAQKRLALLLIAAISLVAIAGVIWLVQQRMKDARSFEARQAGFEAAEAGEWQTALTNLSVAVARNNDDLEGLVMLAEVRAQVPLPEKKHLESALNLFGRACDLAEETGALPELRARAIRGRGRMEMAFGQITRLSQSSMELLEIIPNDDEALSQLLSISLATDEVLPADMGLLIRGDRTFEDWLEDLALADDRSAMRWSLAKLIAEPESNLKFFEFMDVLSSSNSLVVQEATLGRIQEAPLDVAETWVMEFPTHANSLKILLAQEEIQKANIEKAKEYLAEIELDLIKDPRLLLFLARVHEQLGPADSDLVDQLLVKAAELVDSNEDLRIDVGIRLWNIGRIKSGLDVLQEGVESDSIDISFLASAAILARLSNDERFEDWFERLKKKQNTSKEAISDMGRVEFILSSLRLSMESSLDQEQVRKQCGNFGAWTTDPMVLSLLADLCDRVDLNLLAINGYQAALRTLGGQSVPIFIRLCGSLAKEGAYVSGFEVATDFYTRHPSLRSLAILCQAWINLESIGMKAEEVSSRLSNYTTSSDFIESVMNLATIEEDESFSFDPAYLRSLMVAERTEDAVAFLTKRLSRTTSAVNFKRLVSTAVRGGLILDEQMLAQIEARSDEPDAADFGRVLRANRIQSEEGPQAAFDYLSREFTGRDDDFASRAVGFAELRAATSSDGDLAPAFERLLGLDLRPAELTSLLGTAIEKNNRALGARMVKAIRARFGDNSREAALAEGSFVLKFDTEDPESVMNVTRRIDPFVASEQAGPRLEFVYARILAMGSSTNRKMAIEILRSSFARNPEQFVTGLLLAELLQDSVQFSEAALILDELDRRRFLATSQQEMRLSMMFGRQGNILEMAASICEIASRSGQVVDLLECMRVRLEARQIDAANVILDELAIREDRTPEVEQEIAKRHVRENQIDLAIAHLESSNAFDSESRRVREIATILMNSGRWVEARAMIVGYPETEDSPELQLLLAIIMLNDVSRDVDQARKALDRTIELVPGERGFLRRAANIAISDSELRAEAGRYIDALAATGSEEARNQASLLRIGAEFLGQQLDDASLRRLEEAARDLIEDMETSPPLWNLYLDILGRRYEERVRVGDLDEADEIAERMEMASADFASRFPGNAAPLRRQALIDLQLGESESAVLRARAALDLVRRVREPELGDVQILARAEFVLGNYEIVIDVLSPFRDSIKSDPESRPVSWNLLLASLLLDGQVDAARELYVSRMGVSDAATNWVNWLAITETASARVAIDAVSVVMEATEDVADKLLVIGVLQNVFRRTNDGALLEKAAKIVAEVEQEVATEAAVFRLMVMKIDLTAAADELEATREFEVLFSSIDPAIIRRLERRKDLQGSERELADAYFIPVCLFLNNFIARTADLVIAGEISAAEAAPILAKCDVAETWIAALLPDNLDILDSRARLKLAQGQLDEALGLARIATSQSPISPGFQLTLAEILLARGDMRGAEGVAKQAIRCADLSAAVDEKLVAKIREVIEKCRARARLVPESELEVLA